MPFNLSSNCRFFLLTYNRRYDGFNRKKVQFVFQLDYSTRPFSIEYKQN